MTSLTDCVIMASSMTINQTDERRKLALSLIDNGCRLAPSEEFKPDAFGACFSIDDALQTWQSGKDVFVRPSQRIAIVIGEGGAKRRLNRRLIKRKGWPGAGRPAVDGECKLFIFICPSGSAWGARGVKSGEIEAGLSVQVWPDGIVCIPASAKVVCNIRHVNDLQVEALRKAESGIA